ncbi:LysE family transporter [Shigella flexneri]
MLGAADDPAVGAAKCFRHEAGNPSSISPDDRLLAVSNLLLICARNSGGSALLTASPWLLALVGSGIAFLLWYGFGALKNRNRQ